MLLENGGFVCSPPGEENREREFPTAHRFLFAAHRFLFAARLPFRGLRPSGDR